MVAQFRPRTALVAGLGRAGLRHVAILRELVPGIRIVGLRRPGRPVGAACDLVVHSLEDALAQQPDLAVLAGPAPTHVPQLRALLEAGVPTLVEKPLSHSLAGLDEVIQRCDEMAVPVVVGYNLRQAHVVLEAHCIASRGELGELQVIRAEVGQDLSAWRPGQDAGASISARAETGGGALLELNHEIDLALWFGGPGRSVTAQTGRLGRHAVDVEDVADVLIEHEAGVLTSIHLDFLARPARRTLIVAGSRNTLIADLVSGVLQVGDGDTWSTTAHEPGAADTYHRQMMTFLECLETGGTAGPDLRDGRAALEVGLAARAAATTGRRQQLAQVAEVRQ